MGSNDIHRFARKGDIESIRLASQKGSNLDAKDEFGSTALEYAIAEKQLDTVFLLIELGAKVASQDDDGLTSLHCAIEHKLPSVLEALLAKCPEAVAISDKHGNQPLWTAAFNARGKYEMVSMLLRHGADPTHRNNVNLCALDIPKRKNEPALLLLLESTISRN